MIPFWRTEGRCDLCPVAIVSPGWHERTVSVCNGKCIEIDKVEAEKRSAPPASS